MKNADITLSEVYAVHTGTKRSRFAKKVTVIEKGVVGAVIFVRNPQTGEVKPQQRFRYGRSDTEGWVFDHYETVLVPGYKQKRDKALVQLHPNKDGKFSWPWGFTAVDLKAGIALVPHRDIQETWESHEAHWRAVESAERKGRAKKAKRVEEFAPYVDKIKEAFADTGISVLRTYSGTTSVELIVSGADEARTLLAMLDVKK